MTTFLARPYSGFITRMRHDAPVFTGLALFIALTALPLIAAAALDRREFLNAPVWQKPLQFTSHSRPTSSPSLSSPGTCRRR